MVPARLHNIWKWKSSEYVVFRMKIVIQLWIYLISFEITRVLWDNCGNKRSSLAVKKFGKIIWLAFFWAVKFRPNVRFRWQIEKKSRAEVRKFASVRRVWSRKVRRRCKNGRHCGSVSVAVPTGGAAAVSRSGAVFIRSIRRPFPSACVAGWRHRKRFKYNASDDARAAYSFAVLYASILAPSGVRRRWSPPPQSSQFRLPSVLVQLRE